MSVLLDIGPGLAFRLALPPPLAERAVEFLRFFVVSEPPENPLLITEDPPPGEAREADGETLLNEPPLTVRRFGETTIFEAPGILGWCDPVQGRGGITVEQPSEWVLDHFTRLALGAMLFELSQHRGWLGIHAAAVSVEGRGILLPGDSGAGKSTTFRGAHAYGLGALSDDLVWFREVDGGFLIRAFPRGMPGVDVPPPTVDEAPLAAIVCPSIVRRPESRLVSLTVPETLQVLVAQNGFLTRGPLSGQCFRTLVRATGSVPRYRLEAGSVLENVPPLLAGLFAEG